ncbi:hypothetical protein CEK77_21545 [Salmonella enterica]|nr:hypothetical protein [Salmonella enterica]MIN44759.1 hypothetical protein [Salmonella enterica]
MKIEIRNISSGKKLVRADAYAAYGIFDICSFRVSTEHVDGKTLEQYECELVDKAKEEITKVYKEFVCGGEINEEIIIPVRGKWTGEYKIKVVNKNGKLSVAGLEGEASDMLDLLKGKITPSELGNELLEQIKNNHSNNDLEECVSLPFRITDKCGKLFVHDDEGVNSPTHRHRDAIIDRVIRDLKHGDGNMLKRLGRCMGLLQVAAEIEAVSQMCESKCERCRESILSDFDNPPFKKVPTGWISPGMKYLKRRI